MRIYCIITAFANALTSIIVGTLVMTKGKSENLYRTYVAACVSVLAWSYGYILWQLAASPERAMLFCKLLMVGAIAIPVFYLHHILLLLDEKRPRLLIGCYVSGLIFIWVVLFTNLLVAGVKPEMGFPLWPIAGKLYIPFLSFFGGIASIKLFLIYSKMTTSHGTRKSQLEYVFWGTVIAYVGGSTNYPLWFGIPIPPYGNPGASIYLAITSYAILKHRLMDINVIIRKTLIYSVVMGSLTVVYLSIVALFAKIFEGFAGYQTVLSSALAAGLITFGFQPLRKRVQAFVDAKFFRQYVDREEKLYELSREVITHTTPEAMAGALMRVLGDTLHPKSMGLFLRARDGSGFVLASGLGQQTLPVRVTEDNELADYFRDHPQPFVQDLPSDLGQSRSTREKTDRGKAA